MRWLLRLLDGMYRNIAKTFSTIAAFLLLVLFTSMSAQYIGEEIGNKILTKNEVDFTFIMDKKDLYKTDPLVLTSYLNDGPFTAEISQQSPGRLGMWVGWRIVESYMNHHPEVTIEALLADGDAQRILEQSYYKP